MRVIRFLDQLIEVHGKPAAIRCDNGPELTSCAFVNWVQNEGHRSDVHPAWQQSVTDLGFRPIRDRQRLVSHAAPEKPDARMTHCYGGVEFIPPSAARSRRRIRNCAPKHSLFRALPLDPGADDRCH